MKEVLISIRPKWCDLIASGKKTIELRKSAPKEVPFKAYIYCTRQKVMGEILLTHDKKIEGRNRGFRDNGDIPIAGKVIGEFICEKIDKIFPKTGCYMINNDIAYTNKVAKASCLYFDDLKKYLDNKVGYAWHITDLKIYDNPKNLGEFRKVCKIKNKDCKNCEDYSDYSGFCINYITRPPQSWEYVEEF